MQSTAERYETVTGKLMGSVEGALTPQHLALYREQTLVPLEGGIQRMGDETYIWFVSPATPGMYRLELINLETRKEGQLIKETLRQNITIGNQSAPFTFIPGILFGKERVNVTFVSHADTAQTLSIAPFTPSSLSLKAGETRHVTFTFPFVSGFIRGQLGRYTVPAWSTQTDAPKGDSSLGLLVYPSSLVFTIANDTRLNTTLALTNQQNRSIEKLKLVSSTRDIIINQTTFTNVSKGERVQILLTSTVIKKGENITGTLTITFDDETYSLPLFISSLIETATRTISRTQENGTFSEPLLYCEDVGGKLCGQKEQCSGQTRTTVQGICCLERCVLKEETSNTALGWLLAGIAVVLIGIAYVLYQRKNRRVPIVFGISDKAIP